MYLPESGHRTFEENQEFYKEAAEAGTWSVRVVEDGAYRRLPSEKNADGVREQDEQAQAKKNGQNGEREPLLERAS